MNETGRGPSPGTVGTQGRYHLGLESQEAFQEKTARLQKPEDGSDEAQWGSDRRKRYREGPSGKDSIYKGRREGELEILKKSQQAVSEAESSCAREGKDELGATMGLMGQ